MRRKRSPNFTTEEKLKVIEIISKHKEIINSKTSTVDSIRAKAKAWENITQEFNSELWTFNRTSLQLKLCYDNICQRSKRKTNHMIPENKRQQQKVEGIKKDKGEKYVAEVCDPIVKTENHDSDIEELNFEETASCQQRQEEIIMNTGGDLLPGRLERSSLTDRYHQQEVQFRRDEHDLDMQIKLQKLENERRIYDRLALESNLLRLESKVMLKSLRTWNLKF